MNTLSITNPEVTIIIPAYNRADLLGEALSSVFSQTYRDFEIIVVDDGSTDQTASVLKPWVENGLIRYIYQNNQGESAARNRGIVESKGHYIAFLDSDDLFEPAKLELQVQYLRNHMEVGLVHSGFTKFDNDGNDLGYRDASWFSGMVYPRILLYWATLMAVDTVLIPKKVFDVVGLFNESLRFGPDLDMWRRIARKYPFGFINKSLARVRVHAGNISGDKIRATEGLIQYLEKAFEDDPELSIHFKKRALSGMFSTMAYNLLSENGKEALQAARQNAKQAITHDYTNLHGYAAFFSTLIWYNLRRALVYCWRSARSRRMSKNRTA